MRYLASCATMINVRRMGSHSYRCKNMNVFFLSLFLFLLVSHGCYTNMERDEETNIKDEKESAFLDFILTWTRR